MSLLSIAVLFIANGPLSREYCTKRFTTPPLRYGTKITVFMYISGSTRFQDLVCVLSLPESGFAAKNSCAPTPNGLRSGLLAALIIVSF